MLNLAIEVGTKALAAITVGAFATGVVVGGVVVKAHDETVAVDEHTDEIKKLQEEIKSRLPEGFGKLN